MYLCATGGRLQEDTGGRLGVHRTFRSRSMTTSGRLVRFQLRSCVRGVRVYLLSYCKFFLKN